MVADTGVRADAQSDLLNVGAQLFGHVRQLVHEADFGGQHGVGGVLGEFGGTDVHGHQSVAVAVEWRIQGSEKLGGAGVVGPDHDAVRLHEVLYRGAFFQKFRIGDDVEFDGFATLAQGLDDLGSDLVRRAHRHCGLIDNDPVAFHIPADAIGDGKHVLQIR